VKRLLPKSLAGQLIALLLLALVVSQAVNLLILADERLYAVRIAERQQVLARAASIVQLLNDTPAELRARIVRTASSGLVRFRLSDSPPSTDTLKIRRDSRLEETLTELLGPGTAGKVVVGVFGGDRQVVDWWRHRHDRYREMEEDDDDHGAKPEHGRPHRKDRPWPRRRPVGLDIWAPVDDGLWLNAITLVRPPPKGWAWLTILSLAVMAVAITVIVILMVRRITRPMARLAAAANSLGRGEAVTLPEEGPADVRRTIHAFNAKSGRLRRFVQDRTQLLAAISHDLRTPITTLRLRAEFLEDSENRDKILETLDEMQRMTEATLAFAREAATPEDTRTVDLSALVESLCDDLADLGHDVSFAAPPRVICDCRPTAIKRAVRNLVENAVAYGKRARVRIEAVKSEILILVDDDGPGIPEADRERVFEPFARLDESRSRDTGGVGLGLAIARSVIRAHGGDVMLENRVEGGLRATIRLPR
jgi:signal transduction histidine kinase